MSKKEVDRALVLNSVKDKKITLRKASELMFLSYPQTKRLWAIFKRKGTDGLISKKHGKKSHRAVPEEKKKEIVAIIKKHYYQCKPLFVSEKLSEHHQINYSSEFIRRIMVEYQLWTPSIKRKKLHPRRERRECEGELVQVDASYHNWFEERGPRCHLHLLIDDATSKVYGGYFALEETTEGYYRACQPYFEERGRPISLYSDKRGVFTVNNGEKKGETQFARAMRELEIEIILAHSPQAKGRVERVFRTFQERLIWEMRIAGINTIEEANLYLSCFFKRHNKTFSQAPASSFNAHRPLNQQIPLKYILSRKEERMISKNLEVSYKNQIYQLIAPKGLQGPLKNTKVNVIITLEQELVFEYQGHHLEYKLYNETIYKKHQISINTLLNKWEREQKPKRKPSKYHPWRRTVG